MATVSPIVKEDAQLIVDEMRPSLSRLLGASLLVTGAAGFLGGYLMDVIAELNRRSGGPGCRVTAVDNFKTGLSDRLAHLADDPRFTFAQHDVSRPLPEFEANWVIHAAGIASPTFYRRFPLEAVDANVGGTRNMLELARSRQVRGMLYLSTSEIYGDPDPAFIPTPESYRGNVSCTGPRACYDESKRLAETLCVIYHQLYGTPVKVVRPFNVYGPGQRLDDRRLIPDLIGAAVAHKPIVLFSDGRASRSFCYVRDFIRAALLVLLEGKPPEAYNVGNDQEVTVSAVAECVARIASHPPLAIDYRLSPENQYLTDNPQRRCPELTKLKSPGSCRAQVGLEEGLTRTLRSYSQPVTAR